MEIRSGNRRLALGGRIAVIGVLNVTPDSYVDGGRYREPDQIRARALQIISEGGDIVEIGGESTGPGSVAVSAEEELSRVIPAVEIVRAALPDSWIAVDTWKAEIAKAALASGADMINDVTAGRSDSTMFTVIAQAACPYVMMYSKDDAPRTTREDRRYDDVVSHIHAFLSSRRETAIRAGVPETAIIVDPGLGHFVSALPQYSFEILRRLEEFGDLGPLLVSPSRKSFLAGRKNLPPEQRLSATLAATTVAVLHGASFLRTHDVAETVRVCDAALALRKPL